MQWNDEECRGYGKIEIRTRQDRMRAIETYKRRKVRIVQDNK